MGQKWHICVTWTVFPFASALSCGHRSQEGAGWGLGRERLYHPGTLCRETSVTRDWTGWGEVTFEPAS